ncbi:MAG: hypothetical protein GY804_06560 [Alphaproteobacteria bacterium]|nr:hypothetical protein [Alphaproteobacteria bacterium]
MAVAGKGDSTRPLLTSKEEFYLRDELWRCKNPHRKAEIKEKLSEIEQVRLSTAKGLEND